MSSDSRSRAPAGRFGIEHLFQGPDARLHAPRALPQLAQRLLVGAREPPRRAPMREVVRDDPDRRDDDQEEDTQDEDAAMKHDGASYRAGSGRMRLPRRSFNALSSSSTPCS